MKHQLNHSGQVALIMVLVMTIVSAVVISFAGRATVETRVQNMLTDSTNAFLTAQSGIEDALLKQSSVSNIVDENRSYSVVLSEEGKEAILSNEVSPGTSIDVALEGAEGLTALKVYWASVDASGSSLLVSLIYDSTIKDYAYNATGLNGFTTALPGETLQGVQFSHMSPEIALDGTEKLARITVFGSNSLLGIEPVGGIFPSQSLKYRSSGSVGLGEKKALYGLEYEEAKFDKVPEVFDYAVFSHGSIIQ